MKEWIREHIIQRLMPWRIEQPTGADLLLYRFVKRATQMNLWAAGTYGTATLLNRSADVQGDTFTGDVTLSKATPTLVITDTGSVSPAGRFRVEVDSDTLRIQGRNAGDNGWNSIFDLVRNSTLNVRNTLNISSGGITLEGALALTFGGDVSFSRSAANILQLASGDTLDMNTNAIYNLSTLRFDSNSDNTYLTSASDQIDVNTYNGTTTALRMRFLAGAAQGSSGINIYEPIYLGTSSDIKLSVGAADRLDLASGDNFNLISGDLMFAGVVGLPLTQIRANYAFRKYALSNAVLQSNDVEKIVEQGGGYVLDKEIRIDGIGKSTTLRIYFELRSITQGQISYGKIYRNGVAVGTERSTAANTYQTYSEDITGWTDGDLIQLYTYCAGADGGRIQNFRVLGDMNQFVNTLT